MTRLPAPALALAIALLGAIAPAAEATIHRDMSAGGACQPASSGNTSFSSTNTYLLNRGTTEQYVVCHFTGLDFGDDHQAPEAVELYYKAGPSGGTITCLLQMGWYWDAPHVSASVTRTATNPVNDPGNFVWWTADLPRTTAAYTITLTCKVPPGYRLGLIGLTEPEPSSGTAWTP